jgi:hypothetical protein
MLDKAVFDLLQQSRMAKSFAKIAILLKASF